MRTCQGKPGFLITLPRFSNIRIKSQSVQVSLAGTQIAWTNEVTQSFGRLEEGYESALKDYYKKQIGMLNNLITLLLGSLSKGERQKVGTIFIY